ncbi:hypothetical protein LSH36_3440g00001, partial [Paralvinella palmiformis]
MKSLDDMREMSASRASLSFLDASRDERLNSETTSNSSGLQEKQQMFKSYDSLDALSTGDMMANDEDYGRQFYCDLMRHLANVTINGIEDSPEVYICTARDNFHGTREDVSTESGVTVSDESSLLMEARPSPVDTGKQKEFVTFLMKLL